MPPDMKALADRLERVERENRRIKTLGVLLLVLMGAMLVTGLTLDDPIIGAEAFTLLDSDGALRAMFALVNSEPTLAFFDTSGKVRAGVSVVENAPRIILYDEAGNPIWSAP